MQAAAQAVPAAEERSPSAHSCDRHDTGRVHAPQRTAPEEGQCHASENSVEDQLMEDGVYHRSSVSCLCLRSKSIDVETPAVLEQAIQEIPEGSGCGAAASAEEGSTVDGTADDGASGWNPAANWRADRGRSSFAGGGSTGEEVPLELYTQQSKLFWFRERGKQ